MLLAEVVAIDELVEVGAVEVEGTVEPIEVEVTEELIGLEVTEVLIEELALAGAVPTQAHALWTLLAEPSQFAAQSGMVLPEV